MAVIHRLTRTVKTTTAPISRSHERSFPGEINKSSTLANGATHTLVPVTITRANMGMIFISSSVDITLKTNSTSTPDTTLTIKAGRPLVWDDEDGYFTNPFTAADITAIYLSNASGQTANYEIRFGSKA